jgi:DNA-binding MarR family transcriptional regulator
MLRLAWQDVWKQIFSGVVAAGYEDVNPAHIALFRYPGLDGQRPSEVADQLQITKQSVNDLLGHLEAHGYLTREPDPDDGRARVVRLTVKGRRLQETIHGRARMAEQAIADTLGARRYGQLRDALTDLTSATGTGPAADPTGWATVVSDR